MYKRRPRSMLMLPILLVLLAIVIILAARTQGRPEPLKLPDGSLLTLEAVTYGSRHEVVLGPWWVKVLRPVVPEGWRHDLYHRFHCRVQSLTAPTPETLVFWTVRRGVQPPVISRIPLYNSPRLVAFDEHGCEIEAAGYATRYFNGWGSSEAIEAWVLPVFPRRGKTVGLRAFMLSPEQKWVHAFEWTVRNPTPGPHPVWQPHPLPLTARTGDLKVTLTGLTGGVKLADRGGWPAGGRVLTRATFQVARGGRPANEWEPVGIQVSDASGNTWSSLGFPPPESRASKRIAIEGAPWRDEPAWKLRVEMARVTSFTPEELLTFRNLPVPRLDKPAHPNRTLTYHGLRLRLQTISGPFPPRPPPRKALFNTSLQLYLTPPSDAVRLTLVRATDDRGRPLSVSRFGRRGKDGRHSCGFDLPPGAKSLNLTFALQKSRFVEFLAKPSHP
jgi:hypothetical protein